MQRVNFSHRQALHDLAATRHLEQQALINLPQHALMARAGLAVAKLAMAIAPHAQRIWVAAGPGNNGGDGLEAAMHLQRWGKNPLVTWLGAVETASADTKISHLKAIDAGVAFVKEAPERYDLCVDALFGIGANLREPDGPMAEWIAHINSQDVPVLAVDVPTGLQADTGSSCATPVKASHTLSLLTLKPGLFTAYGCDLAGKVWFDDLQNKQEVAITAPPTPCAWLAGEPDQVARPHASHKGSFGDVAVIGGARGMTGAALLAASAALHGGSGRVFVSLLDEQALPFDPLQPELMFRQLETLALNTMSVVCGCGGGNAISSHLPLLLKTSKNLVLDADALNAIANSTPLQELLRARGQQQQTTILTPHPLEAARLLTCSAAEIQANRLSCAEQLAQRFTCIVVLKGSGTVITEPGKTPVINPTGNARLATAGTGDVLAGLISARLATGLNGFDAACRAVYQHGKVADFWPQERALTASKLAQALTA